LNSFPESINDLIDAFSRLPGIGRKTAQRLTFYVLKENDEQVSIFSDALKAVKSRIRNCSLCHGITENKLCPICEDVKRDKNTLCIVENAQDVFVFERTNTFKGVYHVLGGVLSPLDGISPEDLNISTLTSRITEGMEIILATSSSVEGETTSLYLTKIFEDKKITVTRLARGLPVGGDLDYIDEATLVRALEGRTSV
jgi:recombination protein RecR